MAHHTRTGTYIEVVSAPPLKLDEWQRLRQAEKAANNFLKGNEWFVSACVSFWTKDLGKTIVGMIKVRVKKDTSSGDLRATVPTKMNGVTVTVVKDPF